MRFRIDNLPNRTTEEDIRQFFSVYGDVSSVTLLSGPLRSKQLGTGLIELKNINIQDIGVIPDRCLFRGTVMHITQNCSSPGGRSPGHPATPVDPHASGPRQPDKRSKNVLHVTSIEEVFDPTTGRPNGWCRYSIKSLSGSITGLRNGSVAEVTLYAEHAAEAFNLRNMPGQERQPIWTSRHKK